MTVYDMALPHLPRRVALIFGGISPEHEISIQSAAKVADGLADLARHGNMSVQAIYIDCEGQWVWASPREGRLPGRNFILQAPRWALDPGQFQSQALDFPQGLARLAAEGHEAAMLIMHGIAGEDGRIQGALDLARIPYTGSGAAASSLALDKPRCQAVLRAAGLPIATSTSIHGNAMGGAERILKLIGLPCVVKPARGGSSVGVTIVREAPSVRMTLLSLVEALEKALQIDEEVMAEQYVSGRELTCGLIEDGGELIALPITEIIPPEGRFFDYDAKYLAGASREITPAEIDPALKVRLQMLARAAHLACGCRGFSRVDFIADPGEPVILEINTIPGMTATSLLPQAAACMGLDFPRLLARMLSSARHG